MDIETPIEIKQEQLPQVRRITRLDQIPKVIPTGTAGMPRTPRAIPQAVKKITPSEKSRSPLRYYLIGLIIFGIISLELAIIYRYDTLNRRLYNISVSLKDRLAVSQHAFRHADKINIKLVNSRSGLIGNYMKLGSQYRILQFRIDNYKEIFGLLSLAKSSKIDALEGDLRVAYARIGAVDAQNELLSKKIAGRDESINELTSKLIKNIGEQSALVKENLRLTEEYDELSKELQVVKENTAVILLEGEDANK